MTKEQAQKIVFSVLKADFKEINPQKIIIVFKKDCDFYMAVKLISPKIILSIDKEILSFSEMAFKGCLAHELCHIIDFKKRNFLDKIKFFFLSSITEKERRADSMTIEKGYGAELLQFHREHNKEYESYKKDEGLTKREIKKELKLRRSK